MHEVEAQWQPPKPPLKDQNRVALAAVVNVDEIFVVQE
jgi:hypothetical protein